MRSTRQTAVIVFWCVVLGIFMQFLSLFLLTVDLPNDATGEEVTNSLDQHAPTFVVQVLLGIVCWVLLPFAIHHDPREEDPRNNFTGRPRTLIFGLIVCLLGFSPLGSIAALVAFVSLASRRSMMWSLVATAGSIGSVFIEPLLTFEDPELLPATDYLVLVLIASVVVLLIAQFRGLRRERMQQLVALAEHNQQEFARKVSEARQQERLSIARDMHDSLSHRLSLIAIHSGILEVRDDLPPETYMSEAALIRNEASAAVDDLRNVLSTLREAEDRNPNDSIEQIVGAAQHAGENVTLHVDETMPLSDIASLPRILQHTLTRTVQEGLTNARKHAPGAPVAVTLNNNRRNLRLSISNPVSSKPTQVAEGSGTGLIGLAERAQLVGGNLSIPELPSAHGQLFTLEVTLPLYPHGSEIDRG